MTRYYSSIIRPSTLLIALVLGLITGASAQERIVSVDQGIGTLNEAITSDTTDTGDRVDPENTVYELEPGGFYGLVGSIENRFPLYIRAREGARAQLVPAVGEGGESSRPFRARDDIRLENLYITNRDEAGGFNTRIIRVSADSARVIIDNTHLDFDGQSGLRLDNDWNVIKITNSVISNIGRSASLDNGRGVDTRGNNVDTLIYHNNTFYNITSRLVRDGGGFIKYADMSRNTVYNVAQQGFSFGEVQEVHINNNLFMNLGFLGQNDSTFAEREIVGIDSLNPDREGDQIIEISHNFFYTDPAVIAAQPDSVNVMRLVDPLSPAAEVLANDPTNVVDTVSVEFVEALALGSSFDIMAVPAVPTDLIAEFWNANTNGLPEDDLPPMDNGGGGAIPADETLPFNFRYAESEAAFTGDDS
ncbi:MAG: right-handed parallel beta-helix repeat-containing protein, partial [Rhodothermia bacterium]